jgi:tetratricopeptide (TPR) repeat protein
LDAGFRDLSQQVGEGFQTVSENLQAMDETLSDGFVVLHADLRSVEETVNDFSARVSIGFGRVEAQLGSLADSLTDLMKVAKTPEQTWALEQFEIGRDAFRKKLYEEAIELFERAIDGYGGRTGYKLDHRPHHMLGILYRGDLDSFPEDRIDLTKSEQSYLNAARYARADHKTDAARAYVGAAAAAYASQELSRALAHVRAAIAQNEWCAEAHFMQSKCWFQLANDHEGVLALQKALEIDPEYCIRAFSEPEFVGHEQAISVMLGSLTTQTSRMCNEYRVDCDAFLKSFRSAVQTVLTDEGWQFAIDAGVRYQGDTLLERIAKVVDGRLALVRSHNEYLDARRAAAEKFGITLELALIACAFSEWRSRIEQPLQSLADLAREKSLVEKRYSGPDPHTAGNGPDAVAVGLVVTVLSFIVFVIRQFVLIADLPTASMDTQLLFWKGVLLQAPLYSLGIGLGGWAVAAIWKGVKINHAADMKRQFEGERARAAMRAKDATLRAGETLKSLLAGIQERILEKKGRLFNCIS